MKAVVVGLVVLLSTLASGQTRSRQIQVGVNLPWIEERYGSDFGHSQTHPEWGVGFDANKLDRAFADMERMGLSIVRIWVFEDLEGLVFDDDGYVSGVDPVLLNNFVSAADLAASHGLSLYPCLANNVYTSCKVNRKRDFISDTKARKAYYQNAVTPFVKRLQRKKLFAIDLINEPECEGQSRANYKWTTIRDFVKEGVAAVKRADRTRKVSFGALPIPLDAATVQKYRGMGVDFHDFHVYRTDGVLPPVRSLGLGLPVFIGECGVRLEDCQDDTVLARGVANFIRNARQGGYVGMLYWCYGHPDSKSPRMQLLRGNGSAEWRPVAKVFRLAR